MFIYLILLSLITVLVYWYFLSWPYRHWQRLGFPYLKAQTPFGILDSVLRTRQKSFGMAIHSAYESRPDEDVLGVYLINRPALLIRNPSLARDIVSKEFQSFHDRGVYVDEERDPLSAGLFFLKGRSWKSLRQRLSPSFSASKLKGMFSTIHDVSNKMVEHLDSLITANDASISQGHNGERREKATVRVELKQIFTIYAVDIIASVMFGLEVNSFKDPDNRFYNISKHLNRNSFMSVLRGTCQFMFPSLEKFFQMIGLRETGPKQMRAIVQETIDFRNQHNLIRKDILQLLLQLRNTGKIHTDDDDDGDENAARNDEDNNKNWEAKMSKDGDGESISVDLITAQLFIFYLAGFETTSGTISFALNEISQRPKVLKRLIQDIEEALEKHQQKITYESLQDMKYLDLCIMETLRKYPGLPVLNRECTEDYTLPDSKLTIPRGTPVLIPIFGIQRDPANFKDPLDFKPERFCDESTSSLAYMPFGEGPRHCIAQRMGVLNVKMAIVQVLTNFHIHVKDKVEEMEIGNFGVPIIPKNGIFVELSRKEKPTHPHTGENYREKIHD